MINVAVLGTGFGKMHVSIYHKMEDFQVKKVFGRNKEKLKEIEEEFSLTVTTDIWEILNDGEIDLVDICLPTSLHAQWALEALKKGKHVFLETPAASGREELNQIIEAAEQYNRYVFVDLFTKFSTPHQQAINIMERRELGSIISVDIFNKTPSIWGDLCLDKSLENFFLHNMDFLLEILGPGKEITAKALDLPEKSVIEAVIEYPQSLARIHCSSCLPKGSPFMVGYEMVCTGGTLSFLGKFGENILEQDLWINKDSSYEKLELDMKDDYEEVIRHLAHCLMEDRRSPYLDIQKALDNWDMVERIRSSLKFDS